MVYYNDVPTSLNIPYLGSVEVITSPAEYLVATWLNVSWCSPIVLSQARAGIAVSPWP